MDGWWNEIDEQIEKALFRHGGMAPNDLAREVGLSEAATVSVLSRLASEGRVRITRVELPPDGGHARGDTGRPRNRAAFS
jgi:predicted ArsR family transcriptional regulator